MKTSYKVTLELYQSWLDAICGEKEKEYRNQRVYGILHPFGVQVFQVDTKKEKEGQLSQELETLLKSTNNSSQSISTRSLQQRPELHQDDAARLSRDVGVATLGGGAAVVVAPTIITALGFTSSGILAGSMGTVIMSTEALLFGGGVPSWGLTAALQSAGAIGMGFGMASGAFAVGALGTYGISRIIASKSPMVGHLVGPAFLRDGNVVAIYSPVHQRFLRMTNDKKVSGGHGKIGYDKLSKDFDSERFLIVGNVSSNPNDFALYSISNKCFIKVDSGNTLVGGNHCIENGDPIQQEIFKVQNHDNGQFSLFSSFINKYVRLHPNGQMDCGAEHAMSWEHFVLVVITVVKK
jgi:hypothetical protein